MTRSLRLWLIASITASSVCAPISAYSYVRRDEYAYNSARINLAFEYGHTDAKTESYGRERTSSSSQFREIYTLDLKGRILSRNLFIYDLGASLTKNANEYGAGHKRETTVTRYHLRTVILPKSRIPLTLRATRSINESGGGSKSASVTTSYGVHWLGRFTTLPVMRLSYDRSKGESGALKAISDSYALGLKKELWGSRNDADFSRSESTPNTSKDLKSSNTRINASSAVDLSKNTKLAAYGTSYSSRSTKGAGSDSQGLRLNFRSAPSAEFKQNHGYSFAGTKFGSTKTEGSFYSGNMSYAILPNLGTSLGVTSNNYVNRTNESRVTSDSLSSVAGVGYSVGRVSFSEGLNYSKSQTNVPASTTTAVSSNTGLSYSLGKWTLSESVGYSKAQSRTVHPTYARNNSSTISSTTSAGYKSKFEFGIADASASLGYVDAKANGVTGLRGITEGLSAGATVTKLEFSTLSLTAAYSQTENKAAERSKNRTLDFSANGGNKYWAKYVNLTASYNKSYARSWLEESYTTNDAYNLSAISSYFVTVLEMNMTGTKHFNKYLGVSTTEGKTFSLSRTFTLFRNQLSSSVGRMIYGYTYPGGEQMSTVTNYSLSYTRNIYQSGRLGLNAMRVESKQKVTQSNNSTLSANIGYQLRSWFASVDYSYGIDEQGGYRRTESRYFARLSRGLGFFY